LFALGLLGSKCRHGERLAPPGGALRPVRAGLKPGPEFPSFSLQETFMTVHVGDKIPSATLMEMQEGGPKPVKTDDLFAGKKVVIFALPGAFTPTCSAKHVPGFIQNADAIRAKGVDAI